jgi:hypothetical protein
LLVQGTHVPLLQIGFVGSVQSPLLQHSLHLPLQFFVPCGQTQVSVVS